MKAAVFRGSGKPLAIETLDDPAPGASDLIIKVHRCGICGTDLHNDQIGAKHMVQSVSVVTGASRGLGRGIARALGSRRFTV